MLPAESVDWYATPRPAAAVSGSDRRFTSTRAASRRVTLSMSPSRAAKWSAVNPFFVRARGSAPASISWETTSGWRSAAAHINAVWCCVGSAAFTAAPRVSSIFTAAAAPVAAHVMSGVSPVLIGVSAFAPAFRSSSTISALALVHARDSGVMPN